MMDLLATLDTLRRPRLLIQAARIGASDYRRTAHLPRHLGHRRLPEPGAALAQLMDMERTLNRQRKSGDGTYMATDHVDVLIAMMGEARLLRASRQERAQLKASGIEAFLPAT